ncbi:cadherin-like beta sandwich domain-containing protein [Eubacterium sp. AB3007]|uniref:cadherin-like beta sandwich domain-containing protein n=1 Tax=Eubacterium sp. AB3007 TaxID=1392487 RepID=UPI00054F3AD5|nr:cadherin-like beta sandwich domain-containing protein [Eubacterium sp. AB3007]
MQQTLKRISMLLLAMVMILTFMPKETFAAESGSEGFLSAVRVGAAPGYTVSPAFEGAPGEYTFEMPENITTLAVAPTRSEAGKDATITAKWVNQNTGKESSGKITGNFLNLTGFRKADTASGCSFSLECEKAGETQVYTFTNKVTSHLKGLKMEAGGSTLKYAPAFKQDTMEYAATVLDSTEKVSVEATPYAAGYEVTIAGQKAEDGKAEVALTGETTEIPVVVQGAGFEATTYTISVKKMASCAVRFETTPEDASVYMTDPDGDRVMPAADGTFKVKGGMDYNYTVTKAGYVGQKEKLNVAEDTVRTVTLEKAASNTEIDPSIPSVWPNFRASDNNMAIVDLPTPTSADMTQLNWVNREGSYSWPQILVGDKVVSATGNSLRLIDKKTGKTEQTTAMAGAQNYTNVPMTYKDGVIYCPLDNGAVQAFDAGTLKSLWVFRDPKGGQAQSTVVISDGYAYMGFMNNGNGDVHYACFSITDEDPEKENEIKLPTWTHTQAGGFYWAIPVVVGDYLVIGTENGTTNDKDPGQIISLDKKTGKVMDRLDVTGDVRTAVAYDKATDRYYASTTGGEVVSFSFDKATGKFSDKKSSEAISMLAKCTPVVYKGVVYVGSGNFKSGNMIALDADTLATKWTVPLKGKGQTQGSFILSTAYEEESGYIYLYATYNGLPGGIDMVKVKPDETDAANVVVEQIYDAEGYSQYCNCSLIADENGCLYYKNDTGNVFSVGPVTAAIESLTAEGGTPAWDKEFKKSKDNYNVTVTPGTKSVKFSFVPAEGSTVEMNGKELTGNTCDVKVREGKAELVLTAVSGKNTKTYTVNIRERKEDALATIMVNESNSYGSAKTMSPEFDPEGKAFAVYKAGASRSFENVWVDPSDANATAKVYALSGVPENRLSDKETGEINVTATNNGHHRYACYFDQSNATASPIKLKVVVTAESGEVTKEYLLTITKASYADSEDAQKLCDSMDPSAYVGAAKDAVAEAKENLQKALESGTPAQITEAMTAAQKVLNENKTTAELLEEQEKKLAQAMAELETAKQDIKDAQESADNAMEAAENAQKAAEDAQKDAQQKIDEANQSIEDLKKALDEEKDKTKDLEARLDEALKQVEAAQQAAEKAQKAAEAAQKAADKAQASAGGASKQASSASATAGTAVKKADKVAATQAKVQTVKKFKTKAKKHKKAVLSWKKNTNVSGYQVARANKKKGSFKVIAQLDGTSKAKFKDTKLKKGKKYFYKVRTFTKVGGKTVYGKWSPVKKIKAKK